MMTPLMTLLLLTVAVSVTAAPHGENPVTEDRNIVNSFPNQVNLNDTLLEESTKKHIKRNNEAKDAPLNSHVPLWAQKLLKIMKKSRRKNKNFYYNYRYIPQGNRHMYISPSPKDDYNNFIQERAIEHRNKQQESNIFYVRLPPTPYYFVPGMGYISNPPTFSSSNIRLQKINDNNKSHHYQHSNSLINVPIDFVSNGKPTSVYKWANNRKFSKKPNTPLNTLNKGPYIFNGKPTKIYILASDGKASMHQPIRYEDVRGNNI